MHPEASPNFPMQVSSTPPTSPSVPLSAHQEPLALALGTGAVYIAPDEAFSSCELDLESHYFFSRLHSVEFAQDYFYSLIMYMFITAS